MALKSAADGAVTIIGQIINPLTTASFIIYILAALCYIVALKKISVSVAFPSVSASYALVAVLAHPPSRSPTDHGPRTDRRRGGAYSSALSRGYSSTLIGENSLISLMAWSTSRVGELEVYR
jgi:hypothetical protein